MLIQVKYTGTGIQYTCHVRMGMSTQHTHCNTTNRICVSKISGPESTRNQTGNGSTKWDPQSQSKPFALVHSNDMNICAAGIFVCSSVCVSADWVVVPNCINIHIKCHRCMANDGAVCLSSSHQKRWNTKCTFTTIILHSETIRMWWRRHCKHGILNVRWHQHSRDTQHETSNVWLPPKCTTYYLGRFLEQLDTHTSEPTQKGQKKKCSFISFQTTSLHLVAT